MLKLVAKFSNFVSYLLSAKKSGKLINIKKHRKVLLYSKNVLYNNNLC